MTGAIYTEVPQVCRRERPPERP
ncbi:MAG: hypothetical protein QOD62_322, partial [Actinomycetota bacterium]|nr:hypothetical protein [Actinomycetota bacterium]